MICTWVERERTSELRSEIYEWLVAVAILLVAILGRLPALSAWWCLDDWGQLARSAGLLSDPTGFPARWLSQHAWWSLVWPVLGANALPHTWARLFLHAMSAIAVVRIARRSALCPFAQLLAGLLFVASPVAFTPLYWASGIQELLAGVLALFAIERWMVGNRTSVMVAGILEIGSFLSKESAIALPVFFAVSLVVRRPRRGDIAVCSWGVVIVLLVAAALEVSLVMRHFATGPGDPYEVGGALVVLGNLGKFGWWLPTVGPVFIAQVTWTKAVAGLFVLFSWGAAGVWSWRRERYLPLAAWIGTLLSLAPVLLLVNQARPYMGYLSAAAGALTIATLLPSRSRSSIVLAIVLVACSVSWSQGTMRGRIGQLSVDGLPADPIVRATHVSREAARLLAKSVPPSVLVGDADLVIFQPQITTTAMNHNPIGSGAIVPTPNYTALFGSYGAALVCGSDVHAIWTNTLLAAPAGAFVVAEKVSGFQAWGNTYDALLYAAELYIVSGNYQLAVENLARARVLGGGRPLQIPTANKLRIPLSALAIPKEVFNKWLISMAIQKQISGDDYLAYSEF